MNIDNNGTSYSVFYTDERYIQNNNFRHGKYLIYSRKAEKKLKVMRPLKDGSYPKFRCYLYLLI